MAASSNLEVIGPAATYVKPVLQGTLWGLQVIKPLRAVTALIGTLVETIGTDRKETPFNVLVTGRGGNVVYPAGARSVTMSTPGGLSALNWPDKDKDDTLDYGFEVGGFASDDSVLSSEVFVDAGTVSIVSHDLLPGTNRTVTRIEGGMPDETAKVRIRTYMASGQDVDQTITMKIGER